MGKAGKATSTWKYDAARDCYVEQSTGFTATYESLLRSKSEAEFEGRPATNASSGLMSGALNASAFYREQQQLQDQAYWQARLQSSGASNLTVTSTPARVSNKAEDEFTWLRRRVDEVCWKAA